MPRGSKSTRTPAFLPSSVWLTAYARARRPLRTAWVFAVSVANTLPAALPCRACAAHLFARAVFPSAFAFAASRSANLTAFAARRASTNRSVSILLDANRALNMILLRNCIFGGTYPRPVSEFTNWARSFRVSFPSDSPRTDSRWFASCSYRDMRIVANPSAIRSECLTPGSCATFSEISHSCSGKCLNPDKCSVLSWIASSNRGFWAAFTC